MTSDRHTEDLKAALKVKLPDGYVLAQVKQYPGGLSPLNGKPLGYEFAAMLLNEGTADMPRGTGGTMLEAVQKAVTLCGLDDGLSAHFRAALKPEGHC